MQYPNQRSQSPAASSRQHASSRSTTPSQMLQYAQPRSQSPSTHYPTHNSTYSAHQAQTSMPYMNTQQYGSSGGRYPSGSPPTTAPAQPPSHARYPSDAGHYSSSQYAGQQTSAAQFFPTPAQTVGYQQYAASSGQSHHHRSGSGSSPLNPRYPPSSATASQFLANGSPALSFPPSQHYPSQYANAPSASDNPASPSAGDRFPCFRCGASFSRAHDRKRHYESQHLTDPPTHRCRQCKKEFSRADSLKRHQDHGCTGSGN